jgi:inhibitor of KinA
LARIAARFRLRPFPSLAEEAESDMATEILPLGDSALIVRGGDSLGEILHIARKLAAAKLPGVVEVVPAFASVAVFLQSPEYFERCAASVPAALRRRGRLARTKHGPRSIEVPVCYDPEFALDLETVAQHCAISPDEVATHHAAARYQVRCVGFTPGFPYLSGLPAALATPRRATPRTSVPAGSVAIGGGQTGIYPLRSPGGWNIIGRTPLSLFDLKRQPAALFAPGDRLRFVAVSREEFGRWKK